FFSALWLSTEDSYYLSLTRLYLSNDSLDSNPNRKRVLSPFTFHLSPHTLPIPPIYAGCLSSGISWEEWIRVLTAGLGNDVCSVIANDDDDEVKSNHPIYRRPSATLTTRAPAPTKTSTTSVLQPRQRAPRPTTPKTASAFAPRTPTPHNKAQSIKPQLIPTTTLRTLTQKSRYTYEGGETGIVTGAAVLKVQSRVLGECRCPPKERRTLRLRLLRLRPLLLEM
ncbi:hypothetical protein K435DRAFT_778168, partial [Dendrothele bispora CBS 962.96]